MSLPKNMGKNILTILNIGENINEKLSRKYSQKLLDHAKRSATDALKISSERFIQKTPEATGDLIGNKIASRIIKVSKKFTTK